MTSERHAGGIDRIADRLVAWAAARAPAGLRERLAEEWLADGAVRRTALAKITFAFGCCRAAHVIVRECDAVVAERAPHATTVRRHFITFPAHEYALFSGVSMTFVMLAALPAGLLCGLAIGLNAAVHP